MLIRTAGQQTPGGREQAEREQLLRLKASLEQIQYGVESFPDFVKRINPRYHPVPPHLQPLYDLIERSRHEPVRALVSEPPRHGKSETIRLGLTYRTVYDPAVQNAYATYGGDLSKETGLAVREMARNQGITIGRTSESSAKGMTGLMLDFKTIAGGGLKSTSVGGAITGRGVTGLLIVDDPLKGNEAARSLAEKNRVWNWLRRDILSRLEGGSSCIIISTRWADDDPIGRMLNGGADWEKGLGEHWDHINLPAIHDGNGNPIDERQFPELAHPLWHSVNARYPNNRDAAMAWYAVCRKRDEHAWFALFQGTPRGDGQKVFSVYPAHYQMPYTMQGKRALIVLDSAAKKTTVSDYNALGCATMDGYGDTTIEIQDSKGRKFEVVNPKPSVMSMINVWKERMSAPDAIKEARKWQLRYRLPVGVESDGAAANLPDWIKVIDPRMTFIPLHTRGKDKLTRALPASKAWNDNRILVPSAMDTNGNHIQLEWDVEEYVRVMRAFTGLGDPEDDVVDVTAWLWLRLYKNFQPREWPHHTRGSSY